jgi:O-antigen/teichoic acid export membrane protein
MLFGDEFAGATSLYYWLLPGIFCFGLLTILSSHFAGRGYPLRIVGFWIFGFALNVVLNVVFLPGRGAYVASLASSITYALLLGLHMALFAREAGGYRAMRPRAREVVRFVRVALSRG